MEEKNYTEAVPEQKEGDVINAETVLTLGSVEEARKLYVLAKNRLLDINNWQQTAGELMASFQLTDASGMHVASPAQEGHYFRINIPGPGTQAGDGFDWVMVEKIENYSTEDVDSIAIRVRPATNPNHDSQETAHFYSDKSTSTFTVTREKNKLTAAVYDRNISPNTSTEKVGDKIRNAIVGVIGMAIFSKMQWKGLTDGLLHNA